MKEYVSCPHFSFPRAVKKYAHFITKKKRERKHGKNRPCATRDKVKCSNIYVIGTTQWEERENGQKKYGRDNIWGFFKMNQRLQIEKDPWTEITIWHIIVQLPKKKKQLREKRKITFKVSTYNWLSRENRRRWNGLF